MRFSKGAIDRFWLLRILAAGAKFDGTIRPYKIELVLSSEVVF